MFHDEIVRKTLTRVAAENGSFTRYLSECGGLAQSGVEIIFTGNSLSTATRSTSSARGYTSETANRGRKPAGSQMALPVFLLLSFVHLQCSWLRLREDKYLKSCMSTEKSKWTSTGRIVARRLD
jgi:hypothetical protein